MNPAPTEPRLPREPLSALRLARKIVVLVVGISVLAFGAALIVLPGPAFIVIPVGLAILATEFVWARRLLGRLRERINRTLGRREGKDPKAPGNSY
jgi:uncharacterized protein (TIGR02611 family)